MSNPSPAVAPGTPVPAQVVVDVQITSPFSDQAVASPLVAEGWHEPVLLDLLEVWYRKSDGTGGEGPINPATTPHPTIPGRINWTATFNNNLVSGQDYIVFAKAERNGGVDEDSIPFSGQ